MVKYSCEICGKEFSQKSHYDSHNRRKTSCENNAHKIKALVDKAVEEKLKELNNKILIVENEEVNINTEVIDTHQSKQPKLRVASMFAGCGGLDFAFHKQTDRYNVVYVNDFDKDSCNTYEKYYKFKPKCEDITKIEIIPDCDILTGGFPCQGFSVANLYRKETDNRNTLYLELVRLLKLKKHKYFIFENNLKKPEKKEREEKSLVSTKQPPIAPSVASVSMAFTASRRPRGGAFALGRTGASGASRSL